MAVVVARIVVLIVHRFVLVAVGILVTVVKFILCGDFDGNPKRFMSLNLMVMETVRINSN